MWTLLIFLLTMALPMEHDIHVSVCDIKEDKENGKVEMAVKIFYDDLLAAVGLKIGEELPDNYSGSDDLINTFINDHIQVSINGEEKMLTYVESHSYPPAVWTTLEIEHANAINDMTITNTVLLDLFDDQTNMVHFKINGEKKKAYALDKENIIATYKK